MILSPIRLSFKKAGIRHKRRPLFEYQKLQHKSDQTSFVVSSTVSPYWVFYSTQSLQNRKTLMSKGKFANASMTSGIHTLTEMSVGLMACFSIHMAGTC